MKTSDLKNEVLMWRLRHAGIECYYDHAAQLRKIAARLASWHTSLCNDTWIDDDTGIAYRQTHYGETYRVPNPGPGLESRLAALCKELDCYYYIQGDPRGGSLYVSTMPLHHNTYTCGVCCDLG